MKSGLKDSTLKNAEIVKVTLEIKDDERKCTHCRSDLKEIAEEFVRREIEYIPAKFKVIEYYRKVYKCVDCGSKNSYKITATIVKPQVAPALLPHTFASSSLASEILG